MTYDRQERAEAYASLASEYLRAAQTLASNDRACAGSRPFWALLAHALELAIKARLRAAGLSEERLLAINHGLATCMRLSSLDQDGEVAELVARLDAPHAMQAFRYPQRLVAPEIDPNRSLAIVSGVLSGMGRPRRTASPEA